MCRSLANQFFEGTCTERRDHNDTIDATGSFDTDILFYSA